MAAKLRGESRVAVAFHGDGAGNQGVLYETLNIASVWNLPVIIVCENNQFVILFGVFFLNIKFVRNIFNAIITPMRIIK